MAECTYEEGFLSITSNTRGARKSGRCQPLLLPGSEVQILADKNGRGVEAVYCIFTVGNLRFFECDRMPFGLCNALATFQWLMQNCMGELNFIYCLIYLDDLIVFLQTAEEHLHRLRVVFDCLREYNLKLKPSKCSLFKEEINYLAHKVSKARHLIPVNINVKAIAECTPLQTYTEIRTFLGLVGHYRHFIKGFAQIAQPLNEHLAGEGASRKSERVSLSGGALKAFEMLKWACMNSPVLAFTNHTKEFLLETDMPRRKDWEQFSPKNGRMDMVSPAVAYGSQVHSLCMRRITIPRS